MAAEKKINPETFKLRKEQYHLISGIVEKLNERIRNINSDNKQLRILDSVSVGLYDEMDKLCKKAPAEQITNLALEQVNDLILEIKNLADSDFFVQKLNQFIAAGDNPELRDVVMVLRQARQGLTRFQGQLNVELDKYKNLMTEALLIQRALAILISNKVRAEKEDFVYEIRSKYGRWFEDDYFDYDELDNTDFDKHFLTEK